MGSSGMSSDWVSAITQSILQLIGNLLGFLIDFFRQALAAYLL